MAYTPQCSPQPLGQVTVTTPGTPVQLTATLQTIVVGSGFLVGSATDIVPFNKLSIIASPKTHAGAGNTGSVYIGQKTMSRATLTGVIVVIPAGGNWQITNNVSMNIYDLSQLYIDADTGGDGVYGALDTV